MTAKEKLAEVERQLADLQEQRIPLIIEAAREEGADDDIICTLRSLFYDNEGKRANVERFSATMSFVLYLNEEGRAKFAKALKLVPYSMIVDAGLVVAAAQLGVGPKAMVDQAKGKVGFF